MIILAHDGSLYDDWVARYALNLAITEKDRKLLALHVSDGTTSHEVIATKFAQLATECRSQGIDFISQFLPVENSVYRSLRHAIPHDPENLLLCGTRVKPKKRGLLKGSVAENLLRNPQCPVLALRVVSPGFLGAPETLLLPLAGHVEGISRVWPVFKRLAAKASSFHLFRALYVHHLRQAHLSTDHEQRLLRLGQDYLRKIAAEMKTNLSKQDLCVAHQAVVTSDWPNAVLMRASRLKVQMILLGVSERNLAHRFFYGIGTERVLRESPCDVGIYRGP